MESLAALVPIAIAALAGNLLPRLTDFLKRFLPNLPTPAPAPVQPKPEPVSPTPPLAPALPDLAALIKQIVEGVLSRLLPRLQGPGEEVKLFQTDDMETVVERHGFRIRFPAPVVERVPEPGPVEPA